MDLQGPAGGDVRGVIAFIGIGSNRGNPVDACREAVRHAFGNTGGPAAPLLVLVPDGARWTARPTLVHQCRCGDPDIIPPRRLFEALKEIERRMGRTEGPKWGPRLIDLDLLLYGQEVVPKGT